MPPSRSSRSPEDASLKTAVIGAGRMGLRHIQNVRALGLELVGVCDRSVEALRRVERELDLSPYRLFEDVARMLDQTRPECLVVATTAPSHRDHTCLAAARGTRFVLCEKPLAVSLSQCDQMLEACAASRTRLAVNHQMRFMEQYSLTKQLTRSERFGGISSITVVGGNFGMAMNGTHYFEAFRYLTDEEPAEVTAWFGDDALPNPRGLEFEDRAGALRAVTASGKRLYIEVGGDQGHGVSVIYACAHGQIVVDELTGAVRLISRRDEDRGLPTTRYGTESVVQLRQIAPADALAPSRAVLESLLEEGDFPTGQQGRLSVAALVAAHVSNERGHAAVRLDGALPHNREFPWA